MEVSFTQEKWPCPYKNEIPGPGNAYMSVLKPIFERFSVIIFCVSILTWNLCLPKTKINLQNNLNNCTINV